MGENFSSVNATPPGLDSTVDTPISVVPGDSAPRRRLTQAERTAADRRDVADRLAAAQKRKEKRAAKVRMQKDIDRKKEAHRRSREKAEALSTSANSPTTRASAASLLPLWRQSLTAQVSGVVLAGVYTPSTTPDDRPHWPAS